MKKFRRHLGRRSGTSIVEYSVMLAMVVLLAIAAIISAGNESSAFYDRNAEELGEALDAE